MIAAVRQQTEARSLEEEEKESEPKEEACPMDIWAPIGLGPLRLRMMPSMLSPFGLRDASHQPSGVLCVQSAFRVMERIDALWFIVAVTFLD